MLASAAVCPDCVGTARPAQLISLRTFSPQFQQWGGRYSTHNKRRREARPHAAAQDLLRAAQPLQPPRLLDLDQPELLPSYEKWHRHPDLLQGCASAAAAACHRCLPLPALSGPLGFCLVDRNSQICMLLSHLSRCEPGAAPLRVAVLLSGGVDSSLALHLLKAAGHEVTAFYLQVRSWPAAAAAVVLHTHSV